MKKISDKNLKNWATWKLIEVLNDPYTRGVDGADYDVIREELEQELWRRQAISNEKALNKAIREYNKRGELSGKELSGGDIEDGEVPF